MTDTKKTTGKTASSDKKVVALEAELAAAQEKAIRALADLENFRRREAEHKAQWSEMAVGDFCGKITSQLRALQLGAEHTPDTDMQKAVEHFFSALAKHGLQMIIPQKGDHLNPDEHEVLMAAEGKSGTIVQTLEPGWKYHARVIAPAKVSAALQS